VQTEYKNIDIYIADGEKHIIIENKIWAGDQKAQIKRYIETINNEDKDENLNNKNMVVIYLSVNRNKPTDYSLCSDETNCHNGFYIENNEIIGKGKNENKKYQFINLNYNNQIKKWLEKSHKQIANITNLSAGISQYQEVIEKLYGTYKEKIMNLNEYLAEKENKTELIKTMREISIEYKKYRKKTILDFFENAKKEIQCKMDNVDNVWTVSLLEKKLEKGKRYQLPFYLSNTKDNKNSVCVVSDFNKNNYHNCYFSIKKINEERHNFEENILENKNIVKPLKNKTKYSIAWGHYHEGDIFDKIINDENKAVDNFVTAFMEVFENYKKVIIECNEILNKENKK
jgi:hypothetical protein